ncbi:MAG: cytochrome c3 family protein [Phycisphaerales bacterium]
MKRPSANLAAYARSHARALALAAAALFALPVLVASWALPDKGPKTNPPLPGELANSVFSFASADGHPEWAVLRDKRQDTTPYTFGHAKHNSPDAWNNMQEMLQAIKDGKSEANTMGRNTGRAIHVEVQKKDGKDVLGMSCTFCHEADAAGAYMKPIAYDTHCVDCHTNSLGVVGASGESLKWVSTVLGKPKANELVRPTAIPHGTAKDAADAVDLALGAWLAEQPPQFPVKAPTPAGDAAAGEAEKKADEAKPAEDAGGGRRRRPAGGAEAGTKPEEAKPAESAPAEQPTGSGRRRGGAAASGSEGAKPAAAVAKATLPSFADQAALNAFLAAQRTDIIGGKLAESSCAKCHESITKGPEGKPEAFTISTQRIPEVWLTRSHFAHSAHAMVSCVSCHTQAPTSSDTKDVMLPGIASCRECHAPGATPAGNAAPFDCVLCHTYHERLPQSVQGRMTIDQMRRGGRVVLPPAPSSSPAAAAEPPSSASPPK